MAEKRIVEIPVRKINRTQEQNSVTLPTPTISEDKKPKKIEKPKKK